LAHDRGLRGAFETLFTVDYINEAAGDIGGEMETKQYLPRSEVDSR
jgi:hypothetical protein